LFIDELFVMTSKTNVDEGNEYFFLNNILKSPVYYYSFKPGWVRLAIFCLLSSISLSAQDAKVDSLRNLLGTQKDASRIEIFFQLASRYYDHDNVVALNYADTAYMLSKQIGDSLQYVKTARIRAQLLRRVGKLDESIENFKRIEPVAKRRNYGDEYKKILNGLAISFTFKANYDEALKYNFKSLLIRESEGNKSEISIALNNLGVVYLQLSNYEKALEYFKKSLTLKRETNDNYDLDRLLINMGLCSYNLSNPEKARDYINEGLNVCGDNCSDQIKVEALSGLGMSFYVESKYLRAEEFFEKSLALARSSSNSRFELEDLLYLARIYFRLKKGDLGEKFLIEAESIASDTKFNSHLIQIYYEFANLYNSEQNYQKAASYQSKYINLKDSIYSESLIKNIAKVQTDFEERENIATIATKEEVIKQQRNINVAIGIITILAILLITVLYHSNKVKKRVNNALSEAKNIIEMKNRELDKKVADKTADLEKANESLVKVNEELDNFIYKTSHDIRGPLASLKGICNVALMDVKDEVAIGYLSKLDLTAEHLNTVLTRLLIINQINNSSLKPELINFTTLIDEVLALERKKGLPDRIKIKKHVEPGIEYQSDKEFVRIILDNLIGNAIKFYNDSVNVQPFVEINVGKVGEELLIRVIDNGIGLKSRDPDDKIFQMFSRASERSSTGGIGLYITKLAAEKIHGQVGLRTTPEGYTEFFVRIPIEPIIQRYETEFI